MLRQFQKKVAEVQSQINVRESKGMVRDPMLDTAYQDLEGLRDNLIQAQEKMLDVGVTSPYTLTMKWSFSTGK